VSPRPRIALNDVRKAFGSLTAIDGVSLTVNEGEFVSLIGPSGCGKTTLLNMIAGFERPTSGEVTLDGRPIPGPGADRGVIFQEYGVFPWLTVRDNIAFGLSLRASRVPVSERAPIVERYIALMGLTGFEDAYPKTLSGGMKQRVALARAYAVKPEFLLMDEPFGALDAQTRSAMQDLLLQVLEREGKTVVLITHSVDEALYLSSQVVVITARPARIRAIVPVPFAYPRREALRRDPAFAELQYKLREMVMREYAVQQQMSAERAQSGITEGAGA
jgi:NitT/TauT family transport system ATP-binding protein